MGKTPIKKKPVKKPAAETKQAYRKRIMTLVCDLLMEGQTLRRICDAVPDIPRASTLCDWMMEDCSLAEQYARAREIQADRFADEIIDIADTEPDPQVARVRMDARKWHASKTAPKKYGDRVELENKHSGTIAVAPELTLIINGAGDEP